ncbi:MAG: cyclic nucleotide-binding domain-containing protein, partial [Gammaproteobacteria bacterium]|nr:cyclic nucleotide-binding domain-containing protein [Gammaproteobacteria bacterium]
MSDSASSEEMAHLRALVPLHALPDDALGELLEKARFESIAKGRMLFEQGDTDHEHVYLLNGSIVLLSDRAVVDKVSAGSDTARFPLAHQLPRKQSARAKSDVRIARIDSRLLSDALARTQTVDYQVSDLDDASEDDWMSMLLQSRVLQQVPASNIQRVMMSVEQVEVAAGEDLVRQGDPGDYYYMLTRGRAVVRRDAGDGKGPCELATLGPGDAFGEEALLSDSPRNSTVTMLQDGEVLRLSKQDFLDLIHNPLLDRIDMQTAQAKVDRGAIWLDLRSSEQYDESHLPGAINFPFESLRYQAASLAPDGHYVLYSNTGGRAMAGAFLLIERGIEVSVLEGGIRDGETTPALTQAAAPAVAVSEDHLAHSRIREAEQRAEELEERLKAVERVKQDAEAERQQHLQQVRAAVDQARRKLVETEEQKREALAAQEKAYADMERLTSSLEQVESERASLQGRMAEIEGLDKQLQTRLAKAERELIGERERAESATSSLEDLSARLSEILEQREQEREQHARERGELKEEMTALQMDLELAQADMQELQDSLNARKAGEATETAVLDELQQRLDAAEAAGEALRAARDDLQAGRDALILERDDLAQRMAELEARAATDLTHAEERAAKLDAALQAAETRAAETTGALQLDLQALRDEKAELLGRAGAEG